MSTAISRQIVRLDTLNSCARLPYVSCRLRHSTSNNAWRRSVGLMRPPPLCCVLRAIIAGNEDNSWRGYKNFFLKIYKMWPFSFCGLQKIEIRWKIQIFRGHGGERQRGTRRPCAFLHRVFGQYGKTKKSAWKQAMRTWWIIEVSDKKCVFSTLRVLPTCNGDELFLTNCASTEIIQTKRNLLMAAISGLKWRRFSIYKPPLWFVYCHVAHKILPPM